MDAYMHMYIVLLVLSCLYFCELPYFVLRTHETQLKQISAQSKRQL